MIQKVKVHNYHHTLTHMHLLFTVVVGDVVVGGIVSGGGVVVGGIVSGGGVVVGGIVSGGDVVGGGVRMMFGEQVEPLG